MYRVQLYNKVEPEEGRGRALVQTSDFGIRREGLLVAVEPEGRASGYSGTSREGFLIHFRNSELLEI